MISPKERARILLVDDEPLVLDALSRLLRRHFDVSTAPSGVIGLQTLRADDAFAVIVSDMRMPIMDGVAFLKAARQVAPDAVRVMLTGQADLGVAAASVNEGQIFRFLEKPCNPDVLAGALNAAAEQHRLITAERVLLEQTLKGSIAMLTDVLALASPVAFSRAVRIKRTVGALAEALDAPGAWEIEVAAVMSQVGAITLAPATVDKLDRGEELNADEQALAAGLPQMAAQLVGQIPRLEGVTAILKYQNARYDGRDARQGDPYGEASPLGARMLKVAIDVDTLEAAGQPIAEILLTLNGRVGMYDPRVVAAMAALRRVSSGLDDLIEVRLNAVRAGMIFAFDVVAENGLVLIGRGQEATPSLVRRIQNHWHDMRLREPARVFARTVLTP